MKKLLNPYSLLVIIYSIILTIFIISVYNNIGVIYDDTYAYLNNALAFSGIIDNVKYSFSPLIPFLTSLGFKFYIEDEILYIICGIIFIIGIYGMFLLLNLKFSKSISAFGSIIFSSFSIIFPWAVIGIDVPSISFSILTIFFTLYGFKKNSNALFLIFPLFTLSILTRYTAIFLFVPMLFVFLINYKKIRSNKNSLIKILLGAIVGILIAIPFLYNFITMFGTPFPFLSLATEATTSTSMGTTDPVDIVDKFYYLRYLPQFISSAPNDYFGLMHPHFSKASIISYITLIISFLGLICYFKVFLIKFYSILKEKFNKRNFRLKLLSFFIFSVIFIICLNGNIYLEVLISLFLLVICLFSLSSKINIDNNDVDFTIGLYFLTFLLFQSFMGFKVDRYFITVVPPLTYILILGLNSFFNSISPYLNTLLKFKKPKMEISTVYIGIIAILLVISSFHVYNEELTYPSHENIEFASKWLKYQDSDYYKKIIYSNYNEPFSWYLKKRVIPSYSDKVSFKELSSKELVSKNATYYIRYNTSFRNDLYYSKHNLTFHLEDYEIIGNKYDIVIYKKKL
jgi:hypothetical protein